MSTARPDPPAPLRRFALAGAGAIGCTLAARLAAAGLDVAMLARGRTLDALRRQGVTLHDLSGSFRQPVAASGDAAELGEQDVVFLCSKSQDLHALATTCRALIGGRTIVVPLVNGVPYWYFHGAGGRFDGSAIESIDPGGGLMRRLPLDRTLGAVTFITAETVAAGEARSGTPHLLMLGELTGGVGPRLEAVCDVLNRAGIEARPVARIRDPVWSKLIGNLTSNPLSVVSGATLQEIYTRPDLLETVREVMFEARLVAGCYGAQLLYDPIEFIELAAGMGPVRTSMLQDHEKGRPLELASIGDAFVELAERYAVPVPATRRLLSQTRLCQARAVAQGAADPAPPTCLAGTRPTLPESVR